MFVLQSTLCKGDVKSFLPLSHILALSLSLSPSPSPPYILLPINSNPNTATKSSCDSEGLGPTQPPTLTTTAHLGMSCWFENSPKLFGTYCLTVSFHTHHIPLLMWRLGFA